MAEHTTNTVKAQIQSLINKANETTGNNDTNLTDGVNALVSGYGQGGSSGSDGSSDLPIAEETRFGAKTYRYGSMSLPEIPIEVSNIYPNIILVTWKSGAIQILCAPKDYHWYVKNKEILITQCTYVAYKYNSDTASWTFVYEKTDTGGFEMTNSLVTAIVWCSDDVRNGSASSTTVYLKASKPVSDTPIADYYQISGETLLSLANQARRINNITEAVSVSQMLDIFASANISTS